MGASFSAGATLGRKFPPFLSSAGSTPVGRKFAARCWRAAVALLNSDSQTMSTLSGSIPGMGTVSCLFGNIAPAVSQPFEPGTRDLQFG